MALNLRF